VTQFDLERDGVTRGQPLKQTTVVIVEDDSLFVQALTAFVEDLGYRVLATAGTEERAVQVVCERRPDVVLMDVKLIGGSGLEAANMIRQTSQVPIVFCTSYAADYAVQSAVELLGNATLVGKPFDEAELASLLANAVKQGSLPTSSSDLLLEAAAKTPK
jgi:two-component system, response regulator PdtaR